MTSLEAIKHIKIQTIDNNFNLKKECIEAIENDLKVLEIIKKKKVDIKIVSTCKEYFEYNNELYLTIKNLENISELILNQEEFGLIKEWLERVYL